MEDYKCIKKDTLFKKTLHITLHYITLQNGIRTSIVGEYSI
jgi:hypothetical protein